MLPGWATTAVEIDQRSSEKRWMNDERFADEFAENKIKLLWINTLPPYRWW